MKVSHTGALVLALSILIDNGYFDDEPYLKAGALAFIDSKDNIDEVPDDATIRQIFESVFGVSRAALLN